MKTKILFFLMLLVGTCPVWAKSSQALTLSGHVGPRTDLLYERGPASLKVDPAKTPELKIFVAEASVQKRLIASEQVQGPATLIIEAP